MPEFEPSGYVRIDDAIDRLGRRRFGSEWTGEEQRARAGLTSPKRWLEIKDLAPARGGGAPGGDRSGQRGRNGREVAKTAVDRSATHSNDPSDPSYQAEFSALERYKTIRQPFAPIARSWWA
jgi:hypothetical protein